MDRQRLAPRMNSLVFWIGVVADGLAGLDRVGTLPASSRGDLADFGNDLATVNAKLAVLRVAAR